MRFKPSRFVVRREVQPGNQGQITLVRHDGQTALSGRAAEYNNTEKQNFPSQWILSRPKSPPQPLPMNRHQSFSLRTT
jgi:hypothetical protein